MELSRRNLLRTAVAGTAATAALGAVVTAADAAVAAPAKADAAAFRGTKPTVVFIHGAFADASGWDAEVDFFARAGYPVFAPPNPLRGLLSDADTVRSFLKTISGPIILVAHSYGGAVITNAAVGVPNIKALVYISAFSLAEGESTNAAQNPAIYPGGLLGPKTITARPVPNAAAPNYVLNGKPNDTDIFISVDSFQAVFAGDQTRERARQLGITQRPLSSFAFNEPSGKPAWANLPVWQLIGNQDRAIPPAAQEVMAKRAKARITRIDSAHDSLISHPGAVAALVLEAARATVEGKY